MLDKMESVQKLQNEGSTVNIRTDQGGTEHTIDNCIQILQS